MLILDGLIPSLISIWSMPLGNKGINLSRNSDGPGTMNISYSKPAGVLPILIGLVVGGSVIQGVYFRKYGGANEIARNRTDWRS